MNTQLKINESNQSGNHITSFDGFRNPLFLSLHPVGGGTTIITKAELQQYKNRATIVRDSYGELLYELFEVRNPAAKRESPTEKQRLFNAFQKQHHGDIPLEEAGVWVYLETSFGMLLTHLLTQKETYELRVSRNEGLLTREEIQKISGYRIAIMGLSVGSVAVKILAQEGFQRFVISDPDCFAYSNLNRTDAGIQDIGRNKTHVLAEQLNLLDPFIEITRVPEGVNTDTIDRFLGGNEPVDLIVDAADTFEAKLLVRQKAKAMKIPLLSLLDKGDGEVQINVEAYHKDPGFPLFDGKIDALRDRLGREPASLEALIGLANLSEVPSRMAQNIQDLVVGKAAGISQLSGTVKVAGGAIAKGVRDILLGNPIRTEYQIILAEQSNPDFQTWRNLDREKSLEMFRSLGFST